MFEHIVFGFCGWDILAAIALAAAVAVLFIQQRHHKRKMDILLKQRDRFNERSCT